MTVKGILLCALLASLVAERSANSLYQRVLEEEMNVEVSEVQNTSTCNYYMEPVVDYTGNWMLKEIQHIKCTNVGETCPGQEPGRLYACMQTYKEMKVKFGKHRIDRVKIYTGCVCAYNGNPQNSTSIDNTNN